MNSTWTFADVPDQTGRTAVVTGANAGIGLETARMLAQRGAHVVLACRNAEKGRAALGRVLEGDVPGSAELMTLDLSDLESVAAFAARVVSAHPKIDLLVLNAGVMTPPFGRTKQGFELQFGTNHLGHFALTARLFSVLAHTEGARIVVVASAAANTGAIDLADPAYQKRDGYGAFAGDWKAYSQSKLANMLFVLELQKRVRAAGLDVRVTAAHPGWTATDLQRSSTLPRLLNPIFAMRPHDGALPTMRAAVDPSAEPGSYWGPSGWLEMNGPPEKARILPRMQDERVAASLWSISEKLTGVSFPVART